MSSLLLYGVYSFLIGFDIEGFTIIIIILNQCSVYIYNYIYDISVLWKIQLVTVKGCIISNT